MTKIRMVSAVLWFLGTVQVIPVAIAAPPDSPPDAKTVSAPKTADASVTTNAVTVPSTNAVTVPSTNAVTAPSTNAVTAPSTNAVTAPSTSNPKMLIDKTASEPKDAVTKALQERAAQYWQARMVRDLRTLYEMESAGLPGGWLPVENASSVAGLPVRKIEFTSITVKGDRGEVQLNGEVLVGTLGWTKLGLLDKWILIDQKWFHETPKPGFNLPTTDN